MLKVPSCPRGAGLHEGFEEADRVISGGCQDAGIGFKVLLIDLYKRVFSPGKKACREDSPLQVLGGLLDEVGGLPQACAQKADVEDIMKRKLRGDERDLLKAVGNENGIEFHDRFRVFCVFVRP